MKEPKVLFFDVECFTLNWDASVAVLFCMSYKWAGESKVHTISVWDYPGKDILDDSKALRKIKDVIEQADLLVSYNGVRFDIPFLQTRLLAQKIPVLSPIAHKDLYYTAKFKLKLARNRLFDVQNFLDVEHEKTPVDLRQWLRALAGDKKAQKEIIKHCEADVLVLEECYLALRPLMLGHPRVYPFGECAKCGGNLISRGTYITTGKLNKRRLSCTKCGSWETQNEKAHHKN